MWLTIFIHASFKALCESAGSALVSVRFIDVAVRLRPIARLAAVLPVSSNGSLKTETESSMINKKSRGHTLQLHGYLWSTVIEENNKQVFAFHPQLPKSHFMNSIHNETHVYSVLFSNYSNDYIKPVKLTNYRFRNSPHSQASTYFQPHIVWVEMIKLRFTCAIIDAIEWVLVNKMVLFFTCFVNLTMWCGWPNLVPHTNTQRNTVLADERWNYQ